MSDIREYMVDNVCSSFDVSLDAGNSSGVSSFSHESPHNTEKASTSTLKCVNQSPLPTSSDIKIISEMFPDMESQKISETLVASGMDVQEAINQILSTMGKYT